MPLGGEGEGVLCAECRKKWEEDKKTVCPDCGNIAPMCECMPSVMKKSGVAKLFKLGFYQAGKHGTIEQTVLYMKDFRDGRVFDFVSSELCKLLEEYFDKKGINAKDVVFTFSPRSVKNTDKSGFDQASEISRRCAKHFGAIFGKTIKRKRVSRNQKGLSHEKRLRNAEASFRPERKLDLRGCTVVLVDDVVTTGASFAVCTRCLKQLGAKKVICLSVTKTF